MSYSRAQYDYVPTVAAVAEWSHEFPLVEDLSTTMQYVANIAQRLALHTRPGYYVSYIGGIWDGARPIGVRWRIGFSMALDAPDVQAILREVAQHVEAQAHGV